MSAKLKPGGLAMLKNCLLTENNGKVVATLKHLGVEKFFNGREVFEADGWQTDFHGPTATGLPTMGKVPTYQLIPFDEPGDDAVDEMIQLLGSPNKEKEHV